MDDSKLKEITVTKAFLPPGDAFEGLIRQVWESGQLTNMGPLAERLRKKLADNLALPDVMLTNNGTVPLQIAVRYYGANGGEIITTPFSYIATSSSIVWQGCTPVFVDIDPEHFTIDENLIEAAITPLTRAILATHVFGNPCNIPSLEQIGKRHGLPVIYDAAHGFGTTWNGRSLFAYGDASTCSFHATKLFHTGEGGALFAQDTAVLERFRSMGNHGHDGYYRYTREGINAKLSELNAAMGLSVLPHLPEIVRARKRVYEDYLNHLELADLQLMKIREGAVWNHSYVPVLVRDTATLERCIHRLQQNNIHPRRYFYPALHSLPFLNPRARVLPVAENVAGRVLCLPTYHDLATEDIVRVCGLLNEELRNSRAQVT